MKGEDTLLSKEGAAAHTLGGKVQSVLTEGSMTVGKNTIHPDNGQSDVITAWYQI